MQARTCRTDLACERTNEALGMSIRIALCAAVLIVASIARARAAELDIVRSAKVDAIAHFVMRSNHMRELELGVRERGKTIYLRGYGVDPSVAMPIGSLSKSFTAAAVRALEAQGKLRGSDALARYVPEYPNGADVTLDELLAMQSGIPDFSDRPSFDRSSRLPVAPDALIARIAALPLAFAPGSATAYSNTNYVLAALVVQRVAGVPYAAFLHRALLDPLRLRHTRIALGVAQGFGCADLESNAPDLLTWLGAIDAGKVPRASGDAYDDGFYNGEFFGREAQYASGYVAGYSAFAARMPHDGLDVVLVSDADEVDLSPLARSVAAIVLGIREAAPQESR